MIERLNYLRIITKCNAKQLLYRMFSSYFEREHTCLIPVNF